MIFMITWVKVVRGTREKYFEEFNKIVPRVLLVRRPDVVVFVEKWESIEDLQQHSKSDLLKGFRKKIRELRISSKYELLVKKYGHNIVYGDDT